jgi:hypothetical protein
MFINKPRRLADDFAEAERLETGAGDRRRSLRLRKKIEE